MSNGSGPEGRALAYPREEICLIGVTTVFSDQCSGVGCQRGVKLNMGYLLRNLGIRSDVISSPMLTQPLVFGAAG